MEHAVETYIDIDDSVIVVLADGTEINAGPMEPSEPQYVYVSSEGGRGV